MVELRVPLSKAALAILRQMLPLRGIGAPDGGAVFPGTKPGKPLSSMAMIMLLMAEWAEFCDRPAADAEVLPFRLNQLAGTG